MHPYLYRSLIGLICISLLFSNPWFWTRAQSQRPKREGRPRPGKPEGVFPDLEQVQRDSNVAREPAGPIHSTIRSPKSPLNPWNGRRVGDPGTRGELGQVIKRRRWAHASRRAVAPPTLLDDQFISNFFNWTVLRAPNGDEPTYWNDQFRVAYAQGPTSLKLAAVELGKTLFESAEYATRNRNDHWYVYDLYKTCLMREPDTAGWDFWTSQVAPNGRENVRRAFEECSEFAAIIAGIVPNGSASANAASLISARVDPRNQPGNGMLTRDANWSVPLLSLPGRAGLDLGLALSYSSMVWTRNGPYIHFDEDNGFPSPGFRLGFPTVQRKVFDAQTAKNSFLMITSSDRVTLRGNRVIAQCFTDDELTKAVISLSREYDEAQAAQRLLQQSSKRSLACRRRIVAAVVDAMDKPDLDISRDQASANLWREGTVLLGKLKATESLDLLLSHIKMTDGE